jgi:hypothetical protein
MIQGACGAGFLCETSNSIRIVGEARREYFDGYFPLEAQIARTIDLAHASAAYGSQNLEVPELLAWNQGRTKFERRIESGTIFRGRIRVTHMVEQ